MTPKMISAIDTPSTPKPGAPDAEDRLRRIIDMTEALLASHPDLCPPYVFSIAEVINAEARYLREIVVIGRPAEDFKTW